MQGKEEAWFQITIKRHTYVHSKNIWHITAFVRHTVLIRSIVSVLQHKGSLTHTFSVISVNNHHKSLPLFTSTSQTFDIVSTFCGHKYGRFDVIQTLGRGQSNTQGSHIQAFDWYRNYWSWMYEQRNIILCYLTTFGSFGGQLRRSCQSQTYTVA